MLGLYLRDEAVERREAVDNSLLKSSPVYTCLQSSSRSGRGEKPIPIRNQTPRLVLLVYLASLCQGSAKVQVTLVIESLQTFTFHSSTAVAPGLP